MDVNASKSKYFSVNVGEAHVVPPAMPTPREFKSLSKVDTQICIRHHLPFVHFYPPRFGLRNEGIDGKLVVDCCGEGVIFREADAGITLEELRRINGDLRPPFPHWEHFLVDGVWGGNFITDSPLLRMQVTRLTCGGFVLAYTLNHCACDIYGALNFITAISEFSQNSYRKSPSVLPSWRRDALSPRSPSTKLMLFHHKVNINKDPEEAHTLTKTYFKSFDETSVFFSNADIATLKKQAGIENHGTVFDVVVSCLWRARTRTLISSFEEDVTKLFFPIDTRFRYKQDLPKGLQGLQPLQPLAMNSESGAELRMLGLQGLALEYCLE
ncbi:hypothetical protein Sjap_024847 [Stephania japonica]|uniref:Uncharacterized protein n=1 Tax=Stephania japonica TaxID=461633 RepID=A0AAP0EGA9_9MAGN